MIILDTNVISEPTKLRPDIRVQAWLDKQSPDRIFLTSISLAEVLVGVELLPDGKRKEALKISLEGFLEDLFTTPLLNFDRAAAQSYALLSASARHKRYTLPIADGQIAAIAAVHGFTVATRDVEPFRMVGVPVINPWEEDA
jgi:predicted nucleic acid-binding protein